MESYAAGETTPPLIEETIGANFERIARDNADREALGEVATALGTPERCARSALRRICTGCRLV